MGIKDLAPYQFKPGSSGNPNGRPKSKIFRKASPEALERIVDAYLYGGPKALEELFNAEDCTPNEKFIISIIQRAAAKGDAFALNLLLDRFIGKVSDKIEVKNTTPPGGALAELSDDELEKRKALLDEAGK